MKQQKTKVTGYNLTWLWVMYELPHDTSAAKRAAAKFLRRLRREGYTKLISRGKFFVRHCGPGIAQKQIDLIKSIIPPDAMIRILQVTDKQFGRMTSLFGKMREVA